MKRMWSKNELKEVVKGTSKDINTLVDSQGHERFIEGDITIEEITGVSQSYGKWSLSGTHLLIVIVLTIENTTAITNATKIADLNLPDWVKEKIIPVQGTSVDYKSANAYSGSFTTQEFNYRMNKSAENVISIIKNGDLTLTAKRNVRLTFDLLIDNE